MTPDRSSLHLAAFTLCLAVSLLAWVELTLTKVAAPAEQHIAREVAPGLAIAVLESATVERDVAAVAAAPYLTR